MGRGELGVLGFGLDGRCSLCYSLRENTSIVQTAIENYQLCPQSDSLPSAPRSHAPAVQAASQFRRLTLRPYREGCR